MGMLLCFVPVEVQSFTASKIPFPPPSFAPLPPDSPPLSYITGSAITEYLLESSRKTLTESLLPSSINDAVAVALSEGASGFLAGLVVKLVSVIDGNPDQMAKKDSALTTATNTASFFAVRGGTKALADILGSSTIVINLLSLLTALFFAEVLKARTRDIMEKQVRVGGGKTTMLELMRFRDPKMQDLLDYEKMEKMNAEAAKRKAAADAASARRKSTSSFTPLGRAVLGNGGGRVSDKRKRLTNTPPLIITEAAALSPFFGKMSIVELLSDVIKWVAYDILAPENPALWEAFAVGSLSAIISQIAKERQYKEEESDLGIRDLITNLVLRFLRAALEGGVQFFVYEGSRTALDSFPKLLPLSLPEGLSITVSSFPHF